MAVTLQVKKAATLALKTYIGLEEDESIMVLCDEANRDIGLTFFESASKITDEAFYFEMPTMEIDGREPPAQAYKMMTEVDVVVCPASTSIAYTKARKKAADLGVRIALMPAITGDTIKRCFTKNFSQTEETTRKVFEKISKGEKFRVYHENGTSLKFEKKDREIFASPIALLNIGEGGNLPSGEVFFSPRENRINGIVVLNGTVSTLGNLESPVEIFIRKGKVNKVAGGGNAKRFSRLINKSGDMGKYIGKIGIGCNEKAEFSGSMLEEEKVLGAISLGFGNNIALGGKLQVDQNVTAVLRESTLFVDDKIVIKDGKFVEE